MRIAIIGTGHIGSALYDRWTSAGHDCVFGSQHAGEAGPKGKTIRSVSEAIKGSDAVAVAIPFRAWPDFAHRHKVPLENKVVIDATNTNAQRDGSIADEVKRDGRGTLAFVAALLPNARLVKAFNTMQAGTLAKGGEHSGGRLAYPVAGDDAAAVAVAADLVRDAGFDAVIVGDALSARTFDQGTPVWNHPTPAADLARKLGVN